METKLKAQELTKTEITYLLNLINEEFFDWQPVLVLLTIQKPSSRLAKFYKYFRFTDTVEFKDHLLIHLLQYRSGGNI